MKTEVILKVTVESDDSLDDLMSDFGQLVALFEDIYGGADNVLINDRGEPVAKIIKDETVSITALGE